MEEEALTTQFRQPSLTVSVIQTTCVIGSHFCNPYGPINLVITLEESSSSFSSSSDLFTVKDEYYNTTIFSLSRPNRPSLHHCRILLDGARNPIVTLYNKKLTAHGRWQVFMGERTDKKDLRFTVKRPKIIQRCETELHVFLANNEEHNYLVQETFSQGLWCVLVSEAFTNNIIATLKHGVGRANFNVRIERNVDQAFIVALIAILHENKKLKEQ